MEFDVLIIGAGVSGMQCALLLGSALEKDFAKNKKIGIIMHQKASHLQSALFNNAFGLAPGTLGSTLLSEGKVHLTNTYPKIVQIENEKVTNIKILENNFKVDSTKNTHIAKIIVLALNYSKPFTIKGLEKYLIPHIKAHRAKDRIQLKNTDHLIETGLYCCGTIAGHRSQFAIAAGSGAAVATDILTLWNNNTPTKIHDKV